MVLREPIVPLIAMSGLQAGNEGSIDTGTVLLIIVGVVLLWLLIDLLLAGGAMTGGMMGGMMMMAGTPVGAAVLPILLAVLALFVYITFFA